MEYTDYMEEQKKLALWYGYEEYRIESLHREAKQALREDFSLVGDIEVNEPKIVQEVSHFEFDENGDLVIE